MKLKNVPPFLTSERRNKSRLVWWDKKLTLIWMAGGHI
jgi:hypothetical protein